MLEELMATLASGGEHIGDLVWWALADARIERTQLERHWSNAGLAAEFLPEPPTAEKALKTAVRDVQVGQQGRLIRLGKEEEHEIVYAIVRETRHDDGSVSFSQEARVLLDRKAGQLSNDCPAHELVVAIEAAFAALRTTHTADDVRRSMLRVLDASAAVSLREHGGVYWTPAPHAVALRQLQQAVEQIGSSKVYLLPVHRSPDSERTLGAVARGSIEGELAALQAELAAFVASPPERASTLVRRLDSFDALRAKAALYRDILNIQVADIDQNLAKLAQAVESMLGKKSVA